MVIPLFVIFMIVVDQDILGIVGGLYWTTIVIGVLFAFVAGFLFSSVAGYMAGLVGSSNNPISGVTIATVLTVSLVLLVVLGTQLDFTVDAARATAAAATAILVGGVVACAAAIAGDNMQDLKAGQIVGATPYKQQIMQMIGVVAAALVIAPVLSLLFQAYGLGDVFPRAGMDPSEALRAPQATLMASVAEGVFQRNLPWTMIWIGAGIAVALIVLDKVLEFKKSSFRTPVLAVAVGIYLPIELDMTIGIGGIIAWAIARSLAAQRAQLADGYGRRRPSVGKPGAVVLVWAHHRGGDRWHTTRSPVRGRAEYRRAQSGPGGIRPGRSRTRAGRVRVHLRLALSTGEQRHVKVLWALCELKKKAVSQLLKRGRRAMGRVEQSPSHAATPNSLLMN